MLHSREFKIYMSIMIIVSLAAVLIAAFFSMESIVIVIITSLLLIGISVFFTKARYQDIKKLSAYLREISSGNKTLDLRDNREGELSILKNEIYKVTMLLSEQGEQLKEDKVKLNDAISDISHQIKTPLTSMMILVDLLKEDHLPPDKRKEFTRKISTQLNRMEWLVATLLKLSKIDAGTVQFKKERVNVEQLIAKAVDTMLIPMDIKDQKLSIRGEKDVSYMGDINWTTEAIINILKNCVEHTPDKGEISIHFSENPLYTEIIIEDTGEGVSKEDLPYIFKRFYKGKNASEESAGIGLAFAHQIITSQEGDIQVTSRKGTGTKFTIKFFKQII
ncbi:HAMP domain-containing sensor histidine kinase [Caldifermentibacillus hisashii]|uniref:sensor histidine kinase n=1 Tax=Bacillaceae TaxID=186817 RepID=UPI000D55709C|nr:HAMP domain-containing sensor histidine kinase [Caldibacillus thermoamylovorans]AWI13432.1 two-component sensor histidine kinase [Caldibacillus thermoamylovorans]